MTRGLVSTNSRPRLHETSCGTRFFFSRVFARDIATLVTPETRPRNHVRTRRNDTLGNGTKKWEATNRISEKFEKSSRRCGRRSFLFPPFYAPVSAAVFERFSVRHPSSPSFLSRRVARLICISSNPSLTPNSHHVPTSTQFTCSPIAPNSVLYPRTIIVNATWLFSFVGFFWWYSDPSMNVVQSIIQKEYFKDGFVCSPLGYDDYYDVDLGYQQCLDLVLTPNSTNVNLTGTSYSFVPFDPAVVKSADGEGVDVTLYNPVGGGTSLADMMTIADPSADTSGEDAEYAGLKDLSGCTCNMLVQPVSEALKFYSADSTVSSCRDPTAAYPPPPPPSPPPAAVDPNAGPGAPVDPNALTGTGTLPSGIPAGAPFSGRKLLQTVIGAPDPTSIVAQTTYPCDMDVATAVAMYKLFMSVNDPCEFVKRNSPFQFRHVDIDRHSPTRFPLAVLKQPHPHDGVFSNRSPNCAVLRAYRPRLRGGRDVHRAVKLLKHRSVPMRRGQSFHDAHHHGREPRAPIPHARCQRD